MLAYLLKHSIAVGGKVVLMRFLIDSQRFRPFQLELGDIILGDRIHYTKV